MARETRDVIERERAEFKQALADRAEARELIGRLAEQWELADSDERSVYELAISGAEKDMLAASQRVDDALTRVQRAQFSGL
jgi:hypothetical protein